MAPWVRALLAGFASSLLAAAPAAALCVHPTGLSGCLTTIQAAVDAAAPGEIIAINAGIFIENVVIDRSVTLVGVGSDFTFLDGGAAGSVVTITPGLTVTLRDLTIRNGSGTSAPSGQIGGGVIGAGRLVLDRVMVRDNTAICGIGVSCSAGGGAIFFGDPKGRLTIEDSTIRDNESAFGAIHITAGRVKIVDSTIRGNSSGGINDVNSDGRVRMEILSSTFHGNSGALPAISAGRGVITNSTISGNTNPSSECVAGVGSANSRGRITIQFSTIADNTSSSSCSGSGVGLGATFGKVTLVGSILAGNFDALGSRDCAGVVRSGGANVVQFPSGCTFSGKTSADVTGMDPNLGPLQDYGGPTETRALSPGSPALDLAIKCPATDQRGAPRVRPCDAGAFEL